MIDKTRILIVEDEIIIAREIEARLETLGYDVVGIASTGEQAISLTEQTQPQLILMDIVLKGEIDGIETSVEIRRRWSLPIIYLTAYTDKTTLERAKATEPYGYIVKPLSERELHANIEMALFKHQSETKLRLIEKWFAASMLGIGDGVLATTNTDDSITYINRVAELMTGCSNAKAIGQKAEDIIRIVDASSDKDIDDPVERTLRDGLVTEIDRELYLVNQNGDHIPVNYTGACIRDDNHQPIGTVLVLRDLSEHKHTEKLLSEAEAQAIHSQKMETVGQLAGGIAHDFNNILTVISGYAENILQHSDLDQELSELVNGIHTATERACSLTKQLLIFSSKQILEAIVIDINQLILEHGKMLHRLIGEDIIITNDLASKLDYIKVNSGQIEQILMNLVINARDAMPQGGKISIKTSSVELDEEYIQTHPETIAGRYVLLEIGDTGNGMNIETKSHIFEPFYTTKETGTGLGLATVFGIVKQNLGYIDVDSNVGTGTSFKIYLPVTNENKSEKTIKADDDMPKGSETILLVEDEDPIRDLACHVLEMCNYKVLEASNGMDAMKVFKNNQDSIDLVVTDVIMPEVSGSSLVQQIIDINPYIKVLYLSGYTEDVIVQQGITQKDVAFLQKPFKLNQLAQKVRQTLDS